MSQNKQSSEDAFRTQSQRRELKIGIGRDFERDMMLNLWEEQFGFYGEGHEADYVDAALDKGHGGVYCYTIGTRNELAAFLIVETIPTEDMDDCFGTDTSDWPKAVNNAHIYMVCVADRWKQRGYATKLVHRAYEYLRKLDIKRVFAVSWNRENHPDSRLLFDSLGYEQIGREEAYYANAPDEPSRDCPDCGLGCECTATFHTTVLEGSA